MFTALNSKGKRTGVEEALDNESYFCPICALKLVLKNKGILLHIILHILETVNQMVIGNISMKNTCFPVYFVLNRSGIVSNIEMGILIYRYGVN